MKRNNLLPIAGMCALIFLLLTPLIMAASGAGEKEFDYAKGDYRTIRDWSKVDWTKIPVNRMPDVPADKIDFSKISSAQIRTLSAAQKNAVSAAQIRDHLDKLGDLSRYGQARQAIQQKYGLKVESLGRGAKIQSGALSATFGKKGVLDLAGKQNWEVTIAANGQILVTGPRELGEAGITPRDSFHIDKPVSLKLKDGRTIEGVRGISYQNGQAYVPKGSPATLDDYYFPPQKNNVGIFFGPPPAAPGNYVAFLPDGLAIGTTKKGVVEIKPRPGNRLFGMVKREYAKDRNGKPIKGQYRLIPDRRAALAFTVGGGDSLRVTARDSEGKTPLIEPIHTKKGRIEINTGRDMRIIFSGSREWVSPPRPLTGLEGPLERAEMRNSVAFEVAPLRKPPGEVIVGGSSDVEAPLHRIITASSNRFALITEDETEYAGTDMGLTVSNRLDINSIKTLDDLRARYPHIDFGMPKVYARTAAQNLRAPASYTEITANMAQLTDQWLRENPEKQHHLAAVQFNTHANAEAISGQLRAIGAQSSLFLPSEAARGERGVILLGERALDPENWQSRGGIRDLEGPLGVLDHEIEHETRFIVQRREGSTSAWEGIEPDTLNAFYQQTLAKTAKALQNDPAFRQVMADINQLRRENSLSTPTYEPTLEPGVPEEEQRIPIIERTLFHANALSDTEQQLYGIEYDETYPENVRNRAAELRHQLNEAIHERTGLYPYSFRSGTYEFSATYSELPPHKARNCLDCAQLEFDQVMSLNPSPAVRRKAEQRYYSIMGSACNTRPCGPCIMYRQTCDPHAGLQS